MRLSGRLPAVLFGTAIVIITPLVATALTSAEIYPIAQQITVRIDGVVPGSGVIIERAGNIYTVVTNWHVVQEKGNYTVRTADGKQYNINHSQVNQLPGVDLAVFQFTSNQNYRVAEKGDSDQVTGGKNVYVGGYPAGITGVPGRNFKFLSGEISSLLSTPKDGYAFDYTVQAFQGMSGGPILDEQGKLVGIHGRAGTDIGGGGTAVLGIPLKTYLSLAPSVQPMATAPAPNPPVSTALSVTTSPPVNINNTSNKYALAKTFKGHSDLVRSVAFSPDGKTLASGSYDSTIKIWNVTTGQEITTLKGHSNSVNSVAFSPDGKTLASRSDDGAIKIWNVTTGQEIRTLNGYSGVSSVAFSPDGKTLASGSYGNTMKIWNVATGQEIASLENHYRRVNSVAFSPDGKTLASGSRDSTIIIWNVATGQEIRYLKVHSGSVGELTFSPDGKTLVSGSQNRTIIIWNVTTGQEIRTLNSHPYGVNSVAFSPDGRTLASGSRDSTIIIWNVGTAQEIRTLRGHSGSVNSVAFSPDGKTLASGSADATIKIWRLSE
ncbi:hypothetical protein B4U84_15530 [Westiellopsis prolifica IICB1]|nr:hypothetical protein B4U84_15530 [Westiellopsis prolifica IICB1]